MMMNKKIEIENYTLNIFASSTLIQMFVYSKLCSKFGIPIINLIFVKNSGIYYAQINKNSISQKDDRVLQELVQNGLITIDDYYIYLTDNILLRLL